jgi:hypothetical protein
LFIIQECANSQRKSPVAVAVRVARRIFDFHELAKCVEGEWQGAVRDGDFLAAAGVQFLERIERGVAKVECARCALGNMEFGELGTIFPDPNKDVNRLAPFLRDAKAAVGVDQDGTRSLNDFLLVADG